MRALNTSAVGTRRPHRTASRVATHLRRGLLWSALGFAIAVPAYAVPGDETMLLDICLNDRCIGVAPVIARGDDVLVDSAALQAAALDTTGTVPEYIGERAFISLRQLNHGSTFKIDRTLLRLDMKLRADRLPRQRVAMATRAQSEVGLQPWSAFVNYATSVDDNGDGMLFLDGAIGRGNAAVRSSAQWDPVFGWRRGLSRFEYDQPKALRRWTVGDQFATARDPLGGGRLIGGFGVERAFDDDPYLVTFPQPYYSGVLESPGTVEIYANGQLIGRRDLAAGPFTLEQLGVAPGRNDVRVIVRDPFGNRSELASQTYYGGSPRLLARGLDEYAVRIGAPRTGGGLGGDYDSQTAAQAWYRRGMTDWLTLGARIEGDDRVHNGGADAAIRTAFGEFALAVATSDTDLLGRGHAWGANWSLSMRDWSIGLGSRRADSDYRTFSDPTALLLGAMREDDYASISVTPYSRVSLQLNAGRQRRDGMPVERSWGATGSLRLWDQGQLFLSAQRRESDLFQDTNIQLSLNIALNRDSFNITARQSDDGTTTRHGYGIDARRSRPTDTGWGYLVSAQRDDLVDFAYAQLEYQNAHARFALEAEDFAGGNRARAFMTGALVGIGGRMFATPPVESGFALVRAPGLADVPVLRENQPIGRTDKHGDLLVREMLPFHANRVAIDESAVPAAWNLDAPTHEVTVARNTGSVLVLESAALHAITGRFGYAGAAPGDSVQIGDAEPSVLGSDGLFYLENIGTGRQPVRIDTASGSIECSIDVPNAAAAGIIDLGQIGCGGAR
jgi:outer membrane usher protein